MPRDIQLPNGTIVSGVPDDMNKFAFMERAIKGGHATPEDFGEESASAVEGQSWGENFAAGAGRGVANIGRNIANITGFMDDEELAEAKALDEDLLATSGGFWGNIAGEVAATAPLGGALGLVAKGASAVPGLARGGQALARTLAAPVRRGAIEGAATGALIAEPGQRGGTAAATGVLGGAFGGLAAVVGRGIRGLVKLDPDAKALTEATGEFIPLSHSAKPGMIKQWYESVVGNLPWASETIRGQHRGAIDDLRRYAAEAAHPDQAQINILPDDPLAVVFKKLDDYWSTAYDDIADIPVDTGLVKVSDDIWEEIAKKSDDTIPRPTGQATAGELVPVKNALVELRNQIPPTSTLKAGRGMALQEGIDSIDEVMRQGMPEDAFQSYLAKEAAYENYMVMLGAAQKATGQAEHAFKPQALLTAAQNRGGRASIQGAGPSIIRTAEQGAKVLADFPSQPGIYQLAAALGLGSIPLAAVGVPLALPTGVVVAGSIAVGKLMATRTFQRAISGQHGGAARLEAQKHVLRKLGYSGRQIATIFGTETANAP